MTQILSPALALITGPSGHEVAGVLRAACPEASPLEGQSCHPWWGGVRGYADVLNRISMDICCGLDVTGTVDRIIRREEGGKEWLVDRVLTDFAKDPYAKSLAANHGKTVWEWYCWHYKCEQTRYAIHAEDPPPLLVARVESWGGLTLTCDIHPNYGFPQGTFQHRITIHRGDQFVGSIGSNTWLEATQSALKVAGVQP